ncbi:MAG: hypothetical protein HZA01_12460, partial [Nitrospinae bacterium]|nr:hypothetical protein [Nitrospinota bacterium]
LEAVKAVELLSREFRKKTPVISAVIGPYSLPVMLMGLNKWLELIVTNDTEAIHALVSRTSSFCLAWANMLFDAGADALGFFEPFATTTMVTRQEFLKHIFDSDKELISKFKGPAVFCGAGGRVGPIVDKLSEMGFAGCVLNTDDDLEYVKSNFGDKINIMGNLNNISMINWSYDDAKKEAAKCIKTAKEGGGYILSDQHGEISWAVPEDALRGIADAVKEFGTY